MSMGGGAITGDPRENQVGQTMREFSNPSNQVLNDGGIGPKGWPGRGFLVTDVGAGSITVDTATETGITVDISNLQGAYVPCAIRKITGVNVKVIVFW